MFRFNGVARSIKRTWTNLDDNVPSGRMDATPFRRIGIS